MRWRRHLSRFLFGFSRAEYPLTDVQWARYDKRVRELAGKHRWAQSLALIPGVLAIAAIPLWIRLQKQAPFPLVVAVQVSFALCGVFYALYLIRRNHLRYGPRALRELGLADICPRCAYDLSRQPEAEGRCPECGERFSQFHPDKTWSTDRP